MRFLILGVLAFAFCCVSYAGECADAKCKTRSVSLRAFVPVCVEVADCKKECADQCVPFRVRLRARLKARRSQCCDCSAE